MTTPRRDFVQGEGNAEGDGGDGTESEQQCRGRRVHPPGKQCVHPEEREANASDQKRKEEIFHREHRHRGPLHLIGEGGSVVDDILSV